ncbi:hypothetical protein EDS67_03840 [candidate division KSB1 bacterium]|nr:MAG: hypothetical protein EDS67_03840 [candidate division KSB1 bacterium]MBC6951970.1 hypothetical protein [candidate division KSB1 bacterium]MCE7940058.1 hypothetical protein [Chlorobi bacterium CHB1]
MTVLVNLLQAQQIFKNYLGINISPERRVRRAIFYKKFKGFTVSWPCGTYDDSIERRYQGESSLTRKKWEEIRKNNDQER